MNAIVQLLLVSCLKCGVFFCFLCVFESKLTIALQRLEKYSYRHILPKLSTIRDVHILCSVGRASYNMAIIIQQDATESSLFECFNCSTCFGRYFTQHQELITLYLQYLSSMRLLLLPVANMAGRELCSRPATFTSGVRRNFVREWGVNKFSCEQRTEWTGIWGRQPP